MIFYLFFFIDKSNNVSVTFFFQNFGYYYLDTHTFGQFLGKAFIKRNVSTGLLTNIYYKVVFGRVECFFRAVVRYNNDYMGDPQGQTRGGDFQRIEQQPRFPLGCHAKWKTLSFLSSYTVSTNCKRHEKCVAIKKKKKRQKCFYTCSSFGDEKKVIKIKK